MLLRDHHHVQDLLWETHYGAVQWYPILHTGTRAGVCSRFITDIFSGGNPRMLAAETCRSLISSNESQKS